MKKKCNLKYLPLFTANDTDFWIGAKANVSKSHVYYWQDGTMASGASVYNHWSGRMMGQPDDRRLHNENCVYINDKDRYFWHDDVCTAQRTGFMCEIWNVTGDKGLTFKSEPYARKLKQIYVSRYTLQLPNE